MLNKILRLNAVEAAPLLLGNVLVRETPQGKIKLKIVETEAYHQDDPASHSYKWKTPRTAPMFETGGTIYVYFTYGMHYALNIVVGKKGIGEGVLLRAAEPLEGIKIMQKNRGRISDLYNLASGPGKLTQALGIRDTLLSGKKLGPDTLYLEPGERVTAENTVASPRVGISQAKDVPWRFYIKGNLFISKK